MSPTLILRGFYSVEISLSPHNYKMFSLSCRGVL